MRSPSRTPARRLLGFELQIALRYLRSSRSEAHIGLLSRVTSAGLGLGVAALILALAALSGFQDRLLGDVLDHSPPLQVEGRERQELEAVRETVAAVTGGAPQLLLVGRGWLRDGDALRAVEIIGYERAVPPWMPTLGEAGADRSAPGVWLPAPLARSWALSAGDSVQVVSPRPELSPLGAVPRSRRLRVLGAFDPGVIEEGVTDRVAVPLAVAGGLLASADWRLDVPVAVRQRAPELAERLRTTLPLGSAEQVVSWRERHRGLLFVLRLEKGAVFLGVAMIVLVASFALVSSLSMILASKRREIGILRALGLSRRRLRRVFLLLGILLAAVGAFAGAALGLVLAWAGERFRLLRLPTDVYVVDHVPFLVRGLDVGAVVVSVVVVTVVAAVVGSRRAVRAAPARVAAP